MNFRLTSVLMMLAGSMAWAQAPASMRATITGSRGDTGKCTIEVDVDGTAEVEIQGDTGSLRTRAGAPATWRRFQCNERMPRNPADFRFRGVDGRGRVELVRDPRDNRGVAVVRIDDPKGGREGYTFDIEWRGGSDAAPPDNGGGFGRRRYDRGGSQGTYTVTCSSDDGRRNYCGAETRGGVRLLRQRSNAACRQGETWGYDRRGIWVDRGCRADFEVRR